MAIQLRRAGFRNIAVFESSAEIGGTWAKNRYPGAAFDIPSHLYSFSFAPKYDWQRRFARQAEILEYLQSLLDRLQLHGHIHLESPVSRVQYLAAEPSWELQFGHRSEKFDAVITAVGQLNRPLIPDVPGMDQFQGPVVHTAGWHSSIDTKGKQVCLVGTGASAVQAIPEIAKDARKLIIFQRTPTWVMPFWDYHYSMIAKTAFRWVPLLRRLHRLCIFLLCEARIGAFYRDGFLSRNFARLLRKNLTKRVPAEDLPDLMPAYVPGCKRIPLSNKLYEAMAQDNVEIVPAALERLDDRAVVAQGRKYACDLLVMATGFRATEFLMPMEIHGRSTSLQDDWQQNGVGAYLGMLYPGFPNLFMLYGPYTNLGHNSILYMLESQFRYILQALNRIHIKESRPIEVSQQAYNAFVSEAQQRLTRFVWSEGCTNWYKNQSGIVVNNWFGSALEYRRRTRSVNPDDLVRQQPSVL